MLYRGYPALVTFNTLRIEDIKGPGGLKHSAGAFGI